MNRDTICVQGGYTPGNGEPRQIPIIQSTTFKYATSEDMGKLFDLEAEGYLTSDSEFQTIGLTSAAAEVLYRGKQIQMKVEVEPEVTLPAIGVQKLALDDADLFDVLKELRATLAKEAGIPAYVVFSNATLTDMAKKKPKTMSEFRKVSGVGEIKAAWYGTAFLKQIQAYIDENGG
mgnify:CR=1 FL=1